MGMGIGLCTKLWCVNELSPLSAIRSSCSLASVLPMRVLVDSWASMISSSLDLQVSDLFAQRISLCLALLFLQGIADSSGNSVLLDGVGHTTCERTVDGQAAKRSSRQRVRFIGVFIV